MSLDLPEKSKFLLLGMRGEENLVSFSDKTMSPSTKEAGGVIFCLFLLLF